MDKESLKKKTKKLDVFFGEFKKFINRGNVMDLAVGVIIGGAFTAIVTSLVDDILMPILSLVVGGLDFTKLSFTIKNFFGTGDKATIAYGNFLQSLINFLLVAFCVFVIIRILNDARERAEKLHKKEEDAAKKIEAKKEDETVLLLREIRDSLKKK